MTFDAWESPIFALMILVMCDPKRETLFQEPSNLGFAKRHDAWILPIGDLPLVQRKHITWNPRNPNTQRKAFLDATFFVVFASLKSRLEKKKTHVSHHVSNETKGP